MKKNYYLLAVMLTLFCVIVIGNHSYAAPGSYELEGELIYEDEQGVIYGFFDDGNSCYVKSFVDTIVENVIIPERIIVNEKEYVVTTIGEKAFWWCENLKTIELPDSITSIERKAFWSSGLREIDIPKNVNRIVDTSLTGCLDLTSVSISKENRFYSADNQGCVYNKKKTVLLFAIYNVDKVVIPKSVKTIGELAFDGTTLTSVKIPNSVIKIERDAFCDCQYLKSVNIPDSVKNIGGWAFAYCDGLKQVTIGKNVSFLGKYAFENCYMLEKVTIHSNKLKKIGRGAFQNNKKLKSLVIKSTKLKKTTVGEDVLKGTNKKLVIDAPDKKINSYQKIFNNKGNKKVKIK